MDIVTNVVTLSGRLSKDPVLSIVKDGSLPLLKFGFFVANKHGGKDTFYFVKRFGEQALVGAKTLKKGDKVTIIGELSSQSTTSEDGFKYYVEVIAYYIGYDIDSAFEKKFIETTEQGIEPKVIGGTATQGENKNVVNGTGRMAIPENIDSLLDDLPE